MSTIGNSLFQFQHNEFISVSNITGTLNIESCTFKNFFHDFTSLIGLANGHGHVSITDSNFSKFSTCGSILRDTREIDENSDVRYTEIDDRLKRRGVSVSGEQTRNKLFISPDTTCRDSDCSSITLKSNRFSNNITRQFWLL